MVKTCMAKEFFHLQLLVCMCVLAFYVSIALQFLQASSLPVILELGTGLVIITATRHGLESSAPSLCWSSLTFQSLIPIFSFTRLSVVSCLNDCKLNVIRWKNLLKTRLHTLQVRYIKFLTNCIIVHVFGCCPVIQTASLQQIQ